MPAVIGIVLAVSVAIMARLVGFDRERAFYPLVLIVIASYYDLFAVMGESYRSDMVEETIAFALFASAAVIGFRTSLWIVAAALAAHGVFDFFHHGIVENEGLPRGGTAFCQRIRCRAAGCLGCAAPWPRAGKTLGRSFSTREERGGERMGDPRAQERLVVGQSVAAGHRPGAEKEAG